MILLRVLEIVASILSVLDLLWPFQLAVSLCQMLTECL